MTTLPSKKLEGLARPPFRVAAAIFGAASIFAATDTCLRTDRSEWALILLLAINGLQFLWAGITGYWWLSPRRGT